MSTLADIRSQQSKEELEQLKNRLVGFIEGKIYTHTQFVIEEPEQNLFPQTQKDLMYYLVSALDHGKNHHLLLTTHSPYILSALNNLLYAHKVGHKGDKKLVSGIIPETSWLDFEKIKAYFVCEGGVRSIMDEDTGMVDMAKFFLEFTVDESCGKCTPCRIGTKRLLEILDKIIAGNGELEDLDRLEELSNYIKSASLCGLGQTAPNPVLSTLRYFRDEYVAHIVDKKCPAGVCKSLLQFKIDLDKCIGCGMCAKNCPADAITRTDYIAPGHKLASFAIDPAKCVKCGACMEKCKPHAIYKD